MYVYFKSKNPNTPKNSGLLFLIKKNINPDEEDWYDSIDGKKYITVGTTKYFVSGPTDVNLNSDRDYNIFLSMNKERRKVIETIQN